MKEADEEEQRNINCMLKFDHYDLFCQLMSGITLYTHPKNYLVCLT